MKLYLYILVLIISTTSANSEEFANMADLLFKSDNHETYNFHSKKIKESLNGRYRAAFYVLEITISERENSASLMHITRVSNCLSELEKLPDNFSYCQKDLLLLVKLIQWSMTTSGVSDAFEILQKKTHHGPIDAKEIEELNEEKINSLCKEWENLIFTSK